MDWQAWTTLGVTVAMILAMVRNLAGTDTVMLAGLTLLMSAGIVTPAQAFAGFGNVGMLTVGVLFAVAAGVRDTGALDYVGRRLLGTPGTRARAQLRMMWPVAAISAFLNNTPVVAMMVPLVEDWARRIQVPASQLLMPLSFAAIMGGTCTLIGTSTNLIVMGLALEHDPDIGLGMFEIALVGVPVVVVGMLYVALASGGLLPGRSGALQTLQNAREYTVPIRVEPSSPVVGKSVEQAGLRHLPGLFLVQIRRDGESMHAVGPHTRLHADDLLLFVGVVESVVDLRKIRGLVPANDQSELLLEPPPDRRLVEAVVAAQSPMVGMNVRDARFRTRYNAAIIAVHRDGERVPDKIGDIVLEAGDTLLLETHPSFNRIFRNDNNFALVSEVENSGAPRHDRAWIATLILVAMVASNTLGLLSLLNAALLAAGALVVTRCITSQDARRSIDLRVMLAIASAFGVGSALDKTGAAKAVADQLVVLAAPLGGLGTVGAIYVATSLLTSFVGNNASAVLMFPVALSAAQTAGLPLRGFLFVLMLSSSLNFATPISYATNLMVYGPGGYRFADFVRFGLPLQVVLGVVACTISWLIWF